MAAVHPIMVTQLASIAECQNGAAVPLRVTPLAAKDCFGTVTRNNVLTSGPA